MTPTKLIQKELDNYIDTLNLTEDDGEEVYSQYRDELSDTPEDDDTPISDLIRNADLESIDFNIGFEQGYMRGLEVALSLLTINKTK